MTRISHPLPALALGLVSLFLVPSAPAQPSSTRASARAWNVVGPYGGDARSFAYSSSDPSRVLVGTTDSWIYESAGDGQWTRLSKVANSDSLVLDNMLFDESNPKRIVVGAWRLDRADGGIFVSEDSGHTWQPIAGMQGQSVRALAQAPSDPKVWVAGTLKGVYRSQDGGQTWSLISPPGSVEIHEVESIAIDPVNPQIIYAGTWHLPWKTTDGGQHWQNMKQGLIVDSDVFSIIIDPHQPSVVYTSACSGIYKSTDAGEQFHKIQGIPSSARRTRVLMQDPTNSSIVYAGTTEGLYRTVDAGTKWKLMTPNDIIINDVYVDPKNPQHILMATDRSGILESNDGAVSFQSDNHGFSERQVSTMATDPQNPSTVYVGVLNDKRFGGVFISRDAGQSWKQISAGLDDSDVFSLAMSPSGTLLAGTSHGVYRLNGDKFDNTGVRQKEKIRKVTHVHKRHRYVTKEVTYVPDGRIDGSVFALAFDNGEWYAATSGGLYSSSDNGLVWRGGPVKKTADFTSLAAGGNTVLANSSTGLYLTQNQGDTWTPVALPSGWSRVRFVAVDPNGDLWAGGRMGVAYSQDKGQTWQNSKVPLNDVSGLRYDSQMKRVVVSSYESDLVFGIDPAAHKWVWWNPGWRTHLVGSADGRMVAVTLLHGVIVQPQREIASGGF